MVEWKGGGRFAHGPLHKNGLEKATLHASSRSENCTMWRKGEENLQGVRRSAMRHVGKHREHSGDRNYLAI